MKILFLTPRDSRKYIGGVETHVRLLTEELEKRGYEVEELSLDDANKRASLDPSTRRRLLARDDILFKLRAWKYLWRKRDLFRWADVVHVHDVFWWVMPFAVMNYVWRLLRRVPRHYAYLLPWATSTRRKSASAGYGRAGGFSYEENPGPSVFVTFHGWEGECPPSRSAILQKKIAKMLGRGTIGVGAFFQKWYGVEPDKVSFGALDPKFVRLPRGRIGRYVPRNDEASRITFYGRLDKVNDIDVALEAFEILKGSALSSQGRALKDVEFFFIGDGPVRKEAEKIGTVTGMVKYPRKFLLQSDFVITSSYLCLLETAALMRPIISIATNPLKNDYVLSHPLSTYVTICHSPKEIADSVLSFRFVKQRENIEKARIWATRQTMKKLTDEYLNLWNEHVS